MSVIQISQQTTLTGQPLQNAVNQMVQQMSTMSPYSMLNVQSSWESGSRLTLRAGDHMTGAIDLTFGPPSTVTAQINLLSSLAEGQRSRVERDIMSLADRYLPRTGSSTDQPTFAPPAAPTEQAPSSGQVAQGSTPTRTFDTELFGNILSGLFGSASSIISSYNQVGQDAAAEAIVVAQQEAGKQLSSAQPGVQTGAGFTFGEGKEVGESAPLPGVQQEVVVPPTDEVEEGFPTWGWWLVGVGGVAAIGTILYFTLRDEDEFDRNAEEERKVYKKLKRVGKRTKRSRDKLYPRPEMKKEAQAMRDAGYSISEIAAALGLSRERVKKWTKKRIASNYGFRYYL